MSNWFTRKKKSPPTSANKQAAQRAQSRHAPVAHTHRSQSSHHAQPKASSHPKPPQPTQPKPQPKPAAPQSNAMNSDGFGMGDDGGLDLFGGLNVIPTATESQETIHETNNGAPSNALPTPDRTTLFTKLSQEAATGADLKVEDLAKLSEAQQIEIAFKLSKSHPASHPHPAPLSTQSNTSDITDTSMPATTGDGSVASSSAFGFIASSTTPAAPDTATPASNADSAFGFISPIGGDSGAPSDPAIASSGDVFEGLSIPDGKVDDSETAILSNKHASESGSPALLPTSATLTSEEPSTAVPTSRPRGRTRSSSSGRLREKFDNTVMGQSKRARAEFERAEAQLWASMKACLEKEDRIRYEEAELQSNFENEKKTAADANAAKTIALQRDDFDEAEHQRSKVSKAKGAIREIESKLQKLIGSLAHTRKEKTRHEKELVRRADRLQQKLRGLYEKHDEAMKKYSEEEQRRLDTADAEIQTQLQDVEHDLKGNADDIANCDYGLQSIEESILDETAPVQTVLREKSEKRDALNIEIEELLAQIKAKREEVSSIQESIDSLNTDVDKIRQNYKEDVAKIELEKAEHLKEQEECTTIKTDLENTVAKLQKERDHAHEVENNFETQLKDVQDCIDKSVGMLTRLQESADRISLWEEDNTRLQTGLRSLQSSLHHSQSQQKSLLDDLRKIEAQAAHHRQVVHTAEEALPTLQSDKALAVSQENYKDAGRIHNLIKAKTEQKQKSLQELETMNSERSDLEAEIKEYQIKENQLSNEIAEAQSDIDNSRFSLLQNQRIALTAAFNSISQSAAHEAERTVVRSEMVQCERELTALSTQYGWSVEKQKKTPSPVSHHQSPLPESTPPPDTESQFEPPIAEEDDTNGNLFSGLQSADNNAALPITEEMPTAAAAVAEPTQISDEPTSRDELEMRLSELETELEVTQQSLSTLSQQIGEALSTDDYEMASQLQPQKKTLEAKQSELDESKRELQSKIDTLPTEYVATEPTLLSSSPKPESEEENEIIRDSDAPIALEQTLDENALLQDSANDSGAADMDGGDMFSGINVTATEDVDDTQDID